MVAVTAIWYARLISFTLFLLLVSLQPFADLDSPDTKQLTLYHIFLLNGTQHKGEKPPLCDRMHNQSFPTILCPKFVFWEDSIV